MQLLESVPLGLFDEVRVVAVHGGEEFFTGPGGGAAASSPAEEILAQGSHLGMEVVIPEDRELVEQLPVAEGRVEHQHGLQPLDDLVAKTALGNRADLQRLDQSVELWFVNFRHVAAIEIQLFIDILDEIAPGLDAGEELLGRAKGDPVEDMGDEREIASAGIVGFAGEAFFSWIHSAFFRPGRGGRGSAHEQVGENVDSIGQVDREVLVAVGRVLAGSSRAAKEEPVEDTQGIGDIDVAVDIEISAAKLYLAKVVVSVPRSIAAVLGVAGLPAGYAQEERRRREEASPGDRPRATGGCPAALHAPR